ncbi:hypothetical protein [Micromonospora radicis]|uniref:hypothetical protein n=1 Tax=Micromonospora radicis TaxID=1894971 RepID=UPI001314FD1D|nr:hypothetical protein [Micromonospora radicis]
MASIWRDFLGALVDALRHRDQQVLRDERRRALEKLADQKIDADRRRPRPER